MTRFTSEDAAKHGRRGGRRSHQRLEQQYAELVLTNPRAAGRVAEQIRQGHRLILVLRAVRAADRLNEGGR